jgi:hypothetical protein
MTEQPGEGLKGRFSIFTLKLPKLNLELFRLFGSLWLWEQEIKKAHHPTYKPRRGHHRKGG